MACGYWIDSKKIYIQHKDDFDAELIRKEVRKSIKELKMKKVIKIIGLYVLCGSNDFRFDWDIDSED